MGFEETIGTLTAEPIPQAALALGGVIALMIVFFYLRDRDSAVYKMAVLVGLVYGVFLAFIALNTYGVWALSTSVIAMIAAFTLIIRPFKEVHFAVLIALLVMGLVYLMLAGLEGTQLEILTEGWYRIGIALVAGALVYSLLHMVESIVKMTGKILNAWPILFVLGIVCIVEATMVFMGHGSVYEFIQSLTDESA